MADSWQRNRRRVKVMQLPKQQSQIGDVRRRPMLRKVAPERHHAAVTDDRLVYRERFNRSKGSLGEPSRDSH